MASSLSPISSTTPRASSAASFDTRSAAVAFTAVAAAGLVGLCSTLARARRTRRTQSPTASASPVVSSVVSLSSTSSTAVSSSVSSVVSLSDTKNSDIVSTTVPKSLLPSTREQWIAAFPSVKFNESFWTKLDIMRNDGPSRFVSIVDFDWTLSGYNNNGASKVCKTSYGVLTSSPLIDEKYRLGAAEIKDKYFPFERDHSLSLEVRSEYMVKWWNEIHVYMIECGFSQHLVEDSIRIAIEQNDMFLRAGSAEYLRALNASRTPVLIMSAGLHQTVETTLRTMGVLYPDAEVCANMMHFRADGSIESFSPVMPIHSCNKSFNAVEASSGFRRQCVERQSPNVLVVGDSMGDINMSHGLTPVGQRLNIGFVNADFDKRTPEFMSVYDAVILNDGNWDLPLTILRSIGVAP